MSKLNIAAAVAAITLMTAGAAVAAPYGPDKIVNGGFETNTLGGTSAQLTPTNVTGWTVNPTPGYTFVYLPGAGTSGTQADTVGASGVDGNVKLYGPGNYNQTLNGNKNTIVNNGLTNSRTPSTHEIV